MVETKWNKTQNRFVAFFDIMGFKEVVERNPHESVVQKLNKLKSALKHLESFNENEVFFKRYHLRKAETKSITFSDSVVIFSKGSSLADACKILADSSTLMLISMQNSIAIKGAISYGKITVDLDKSLFFGRPIIDSYLLHDQLHLYSTVLDSSSETKFKSLNLPDAFKKLIHEYKVNMKAGKIKHKLINCYRRELVQKQINSTAKLYSTVSGSPRLYVDHTLDFLDHLIKKIE